MTAGGRDPPLEASGAGCFRAGQASSTLVTAVLPGNRPSSRSSEGVTTELRFTGLDVGESGYRVPAGTLLSQ